MHTKTMSDLDGKFRDKRAAGVPCRKCHSESVTVETWDSDCGGYEDDKYTCGACGYYWWVEGPDA